MMPATVAPVNTLKTKYHQKEGATAEHMPLRAVTAHETPRVLSALQRMQSGSDCSSLTVSRTAG